MPSPFVSELLKDQTHDIFHKYDEYCSFTHRGERSFNYERRIQKQKEIEAYPSIPYSSWYLPDLEKLIKDSKSIFDIGFGLGQMIFWFYLVGKKPGGIELNPTYLKIAKTNLDGLVEDLRLGDGSFNNLGQYDLLYTYCPIVERNPYWQYIGFPILNQLENKQKWVEVLAHHHYFYEEYLFKDRRNYPGTVSVIEKLGKNIEITRLSLGCKTTVVHKAKVSLKRLISIVEDAIAEENERIRKFNEENVRWTRNHSGVSKVPFSD